MCLSIAVLAFVPFSAFIAMGSEWDENTYDLLIISNLKPRQIILPPDPFKRRQDLPFWHGDRATNAHRIVVTQDSDEEKQSTG